jgi:hypothetical protein
VICSRSISFFTHQSGSCWRAQPLDRLARAAQVVEVAAGHRDAHLLVDPGLLVLDPGLGSAPAGALVTTRRAVRTARA